MSTLPQTRSLNAKRFAAFRRRRTAWYALWALASLGGLSLLAPLLCNGRPLLLLMERRLYFPALRFYSEQQVLGNNVHTVMDRYRELAASPRFRQSRANFILFAPIPYGPGEILNAAEFEPYRRLRLSVTLQPQVGRLNLAADGTITAPLGCAPFFPAGMALDGANFNDYWLPDTGLAAALAARLENRAAPSFETVLRRRAGGGTANVSLSAYEARTVAPATVRLLLRESGAERLAGLTRHLRLAEARAALARGELAALVQRLCGADAALAAALTPLVATALASDTAEGSGVWRGTPVRLSCTVSPVSWPHRPTPQHWMGVDGAGRDVLARVLYGLRTGLLFGILLALWAMCLGVVIGAVQGFFGGWCDLLGQRLIEIWAALPFLYVMILIGSVLGRSFLLLLICYGLFNWIGISVYMRAEFLRLRGRPFVDAARCQGLGATQIMWRHILPNALTPLITLFPFSLVGAIASLSALDFLGFGLPPLAPSWGELLSQAQTHRGAWWLVVYPATALFLVMLLAVLIGEGVRDAFNPKPETRLE